MNNILEKIKILRNEKSPSEIEAMLLTGKLGEIRLDDHSYQRIENLAVSHLVIEVHNPGFIERMREHPNKNVVHHKDGNQLNNAFSNLQTMSRSEHNSMHATDPRFAEAKKDMREKISKSLVTYNTNPDNAEAIKAKSEAISKTRRERWIDLSVFKESFTVKEFAKVNMTGYGTAWYRLKMLVNEGQIVCEKKLVRESRLNVYVVSR